MSERKRRRQGFTLIELLIVIAIILILIAIALPNFLEAQVRAKVTASRANMRSIGIAMEEFRIDMGEFHTDFNDYAIQGMLELVDRVRARGSCASAQKVCACRAYSLPQAVGDAVEEWTTQAPHEFYGPGIHCPLTTPVAYMSAAETNDPFGGGLVPHGYDSLPGRPGRLAYGAIFGIGPDHTAGDWRRDRKYNVDADGDGVREALPYTPTNGTSSRGEFWRVIPNDTFVAKVHYNPLIW